jgi:hypothetical protein
LERKLLKTLEKYHIRLDGNGEVDFSQCEDKQILRKMKAKEQIVKEALLSADVDFGSVHRQNRREKANNADRMIMDIANKEDELNDTILDRLKKHIIQKDEYLRLSEIDQKLDSYVHSLSAKPISQEDFFYEQVTMDMDNFISGIQNNVLMLIQKENIT